MFRFLFRMFLFSFYNIFSHVYLVLYYMPFIDCDTYFISFGIIFCELPPPSFLLYMYLYLCNYEIEMILNWCRNIIIRVFHFYNYCTKLMSNREIQLESIYEYLYIFLCLWIIEYKIRVIIIFEKWPNLISFL